MVLEVEAGQVAAGLCSIFWEVAVPAAMALADIIVAVVVRVAAVCSIFSVGVAVPGALGMQEDMAVVVAPVSMMDDRITHLHPHRVDPVQGVASFRHWALYSDSVGAQVHQAYRVEDMADYLTKIRVLHRILEVRDKEFPVPARVVTQHKHQPTRHEVAIPYKLPTHRATIKIPIIRTHSDRPMDGMLATTNSIQ